MNKSNFIILILIFFFAFSNGCIEEKSVNDEDIIEEWGGDGNLSIELSITENTMDINSSIMINYTLINTGTTNLRIISLNSYHFDHLIGVLDENGTGIETSFDYVPIPINESSLVKLASGEKLTRYLEFSRDYFKIQRNHTYTIIGGYYAHDDGSIKIEHWTGRERSDPVFISVT